MGGNGLGTGRGSGRVSNSNDWFTISYVQPLPYLATPYVPVFCWCSKSNKSVTNNSNYIRGLFYVAMLLTPAQIKPKSSASRRNFFIPGMDASDV